MSEEKPMLDPEKLSKVEWKIAEAVRIGLDKIYLKVHDRDEAKEVLEKNMKFLCTAVPSATVGVWIFHVRESSRETFKKEILDRLPDYWWTKLPRWGVCTPKNLKSLLAQSR